MYADELSDAIRRVDIEQVRLLLSSSKLTTLQIAKYMDAADQSVRLWHDNSVLGIRTSSNDDTIYEQWTGASFASTILFLCALIYTTHSDKQVSRILRIMSGATLPTCIIYLISLDTLCSKQRRNTHRYYMTAVTIKEMLYDYIATMQTDTQPA